MNIKLNGFSTIASAILCALLPTQIFADQFTVNSSDDPTTGNPSACSAGSGSCSFRDALAAADLTPQLDNIVFDVSGPIYLTKRLTANQAIAIDGGGDTTIRVDQGYSIAILPDKIFLSGNEDDIPVLQPTFFSGGGNKHPMLVLHGAGSLVENLTLDGSITPLAADLGLERIDRDSNGTTDYALYTVAPNDMSNADRWLVAGGIEMPGTLANPANVVIRNNVFRNLGNNAISLDYSGGSSITDNVISGGAAGIGGFNGEGVFAYSSIFTTVSGNTIKGCRNGIVFLVASGVSIFDNQLSGNVHGLELEGVGPDYGPIEVQANVITNNLETGVYVYHSASVQLDDNEINYNSKLGIQIKQAGPASITNNDINYNGNNEYEQGGILINEGAGGVSMDSNAVSHNLGFGVVIAESFGNVLSNNDVIKNSGAGIVLLNGAAWNQVVSNQFKMNAVGILAGFDGDSNFPFENTYQDNKVRQNDLIDAIDYDPDCNDDWVANTIGSSVSVSGSCIE